MIFSLSLNIINIIQVSHYNVSFTQPVTMYYGTMDRTGRVQCDKCRTLEYQILRWYIVLNIEFFMLVNQTLLYSVSNNTNNIRFKWCKNSFNAVWKKNGSREPTLPYFKYTGTCLVFQVQVFQVLSTWNTFKSCVFPVKVYFKYLYFQYYQYFFF